MKYRKFMGIMLMLALTLAACAPAATEVPATLPATEEPATEMPTEAPATEAPATEVTTAAETPTTEATTAAETPSGGVLVTGAATVEVSESADFGPIIVDSEGM